LAANPELQGSGNLTFGKHQESRAKMGWLNQAWTGFGAFARG
jgi:hypothetical protein